jgi:hypothetical protein
MLCFIEILMRQKKQVANFEMFGGALSDLVSLLVNNSQWWTPFAVHILSLYGEFQFWDWNIYVKNKTKQKKNLCLEKASPTCVSYAEIHCRIFLFFSLNCPGRSILSAQSSTSRKCCNLYLMNSLPKLKCWQILLFHYDYFPKRNWHFHHLLGRKSILLCTCLSVNHISREPLILVMNRWWTVLVYWFSGQGQIKGWTWIMHFVWLFSILHPRGCVYNVKTFDLCIEDI